MSKFSRVTVVDGASSGISGQGPPFPNITSNLPWASQFQVGPGFHIRRATKVVVNQGLDILENNYSLHFSSVST